jgi:virginiamycin B lyase
MPIEHLKVSMTLRLGKTADWVAITDDAVWVGSTGPYAVHAINPATDQRIATVVLAGEPCAGLAVGFDSLWVPMCGRSGGLARIDLKTHELLATYNVGPIAAEGGITTGSGSVWIMLQSRSLARIDPSDGTVQKVAQLPAGSFNPYFSAGRIWVTRAKGAELTSVDATTGTVVAHLPTGRNPRFLTAGNGAIWTLNQGDGSLSRIDMAGGKPTQTLPLGTPGPGGRHHVWRRQNLDHLFQGAAVNRRCLRTGAALSVGGTGRGFNRLRPQRYLADQLQGRHYLADCVGGYPIRLQRALAKASTDSNLSQPAAAPTWAASL